MEGIKQKRSLLIAIPILQVIVAIYSLSGVMLKLAAGHTYREIKFYLYFGIVILLLGIYALVWQQILKKVELSVAYVNRASAVIWSLLWAVIFFNDTITIKNILGVIIIVAGVILVNIESFRETGARDDD